MEKRQNTSSLALSAIVIFVISLIACGGGGGGDAPKPAPKPGYQAPLIESLVFDPVEPKVGGVISAVAKTADPDGNLKHALFRWFKNDIFASADLVALSGATATASNQYNGQPLAAGDKIWCEVTVTDVTGLTASRSDAIVVTGPAVVYLLDGLCFSPYRDGQSPHARTRISEEQIRDLLKVVAPYTKMIRIFGMNDGLENIPRIAKTEFGLEVVAGVWLDTNLAANESGFNNLVSAVNSGYAKAATLGNEVLLFQYLDPQNEANNKAMLIDYIQRFRQATGGKVPVSTVDVYGEWLANPDAMAVCDEVYVNIYPFWEYADVKVAVGQVYRHFLEVEAVAGGKPVIIAETGWPSAGSTMGDAVPSPENAAFFFLNFISLARAEGLEYYYFEAFDENWKTENTVGPHWGIWDAKLVMKPGMEKVFNGETMPNNWSCDVPIGGQGAPGIKVTYAPPYNDAVGIVKGTVEHIVPTEFKLTAYILVSGNWWVKPTYASPSVAVNCDGSFAIDTVTGGIDYRATEIRLYLIPVDYAQPTTSGIPAPPQELSDNAVAIISILRDTNGTNTITVLK